MVYSQFAILIAAPHRDESSMHHDLRAMYNALKRRGLTSEQILCLEGALDRGLLLAFLNRVGGRIAHWRQGALFLHVSGHGFFTGKSVEDARLGLLLGPTEQVEDKYHVFWDELFEALSLPAGVALTLFPDH